jgi:Ca-activated chloride channel homolog
MNSRYRIILLAVCCAMLLCSAAFADGILFPAERPTPDLVLRDQLFAVNYHHVKVNIDDRMCTTSVDQEFHNDASVAREGMYIFPMPDGAAITRFSMFDGEKEIKGRVLDKAEARSIYESIVRRRQDPALLEYVGRNTFKASVYPVPANGDKRIKLSYAELLPQTGNTCRYVYPLSTERYSSRPLRDCRVTINITSKRTITNIYCPTHKVDLDQKDDRHATVTWKAADVKPDTDLILYYTVTTSDVGMDILAHKEQGKDGFYLLLASPRVEIDKSKVAPKNVVFVLDRTGSMAGEKIEQAKDALKFCLQSLRNEDRFNVITFNETPNLMFSGMQKVSAEVRNKAVDQVGQIEASGGTNIDEALKAAFGQFGESGSRNNYVIFLTDGQPTVGNTNLESILEHAKKANRAGAKVFVFGVGYDVNAHFLDKLAQQAKGDADYVRPKEDIEVKVSTFFAKVSEPLLSDVRVSISGVKTSDAYPSELPDIFKGSELLILGRYSGSGTVHIELSGIANGARKVFKIEATLPGETETNDFIPQLWASRKIGYLLDEIRLHSSDELIQEVIRLSKEYGIPTEYTSFLADDRDFTYADGHALKLAGDRMKAAREVQSGTHGIAQSTNARDMAGQAAAPAASVNYYALKPGQVVGKVAANQRLGGSYLDSNDQLVVVANVQNVAKRTFYQRGQFWEDVDVKPDQKFVQVKQFSDAHFKLIKLIPKVAQYSTLGNIRVVLENGQGIEIGPDGSEKMTDKEIDELTGGPRKEHKSGSGLSPAGVGLILGALVAIAPAARLSRRTHC